VLGSDQAFQYTSTHYKYTLEKIGLQGSHSRKGNCLDNAWIESFFSHLKTESLPRNAVLSEEEMETLIENYIAFYNNDRFQKKFDQLSRLNIGKSWPLNA
jgi:transposase InsO family protein